MTAPATEKAAPIPALLPCPFCGGRAETWVLEHPEIQGGEDDQYQGGCAVACAETPWCDTLEEVADWWNRRAAQASQEERIREDERLRFEGDLDRWMKTLGAGITGYQPEAYAVMDAVCAELVRARARIAALEAEASEGERLRAALVEAREALDQSYNVTTYPGDGTSKQDAAIRAIDAALILAPARERWHPIETAPRDGTRFLALEGRRHFDCWWHWFGADQVYNWQDEADSEPDPTHWMPLPPPPQDREEQ